MQKFLSASLILILAASAISVPAQVARQGKPTGANAPSASAVKTAPVGAADELIALLPATDLIAVVDVNRLFNELLPQLSAIKVGGLDELAKDIAEFTQKTGIDPAQVRSAVLGVNLNNTQATGAVIINGIELDNAKLEAAMKVFKAEYKTADYKGKTIFNVIEKMKKTPAAGPVTVKTDETAFASLGAQRLVLGDLNVVKGVIDVQTGAAKGGIKPALSSALNETRSSALLRFALNIPASLSDSVKDQGDLFKSVAAIKTVLGTFDVASDFSLALDALMRTGTQSEAAELEGGLQGLLVLARGLFGSGGDAKTNLLAQLLDQIKVGMKLNDVTLSITVPRAILEEVTKKPVSVEKKPEEKKP
jgi:hypothetical protein